MRQQDKYRAGRARAFLVAAILLSILAMGTWAVSSAWRPVVDLGSVGDPQVHEVSDESEARIRAFCGDCHGFPSPDNYSRQAWRKEVLRGYEFYARSGRSDLDPPPVDETLAFYQSRSLAEVLYPQPEEASRPLSVSFSVEKLPSVGSAHFPPAVADLRWTRLTEDTAPVLLACDMRLGSVSAIDFSEGQRSRGSLAKLHHPCHVEPCDANRDGVRDLVVADMGGLAAVDFDLGRVVLLLGKPGSNSFDQRVIASGLGRVSDVRPLDVEGDGDLDFIVGEFGAHVGRILLLRNVGTEPDDLQYQIQPIDLRPGAIHLPIHDFNDDGRPDFVALISQTFEAVDAFINLGDGKFQLHSLWQAGDPAFGSSGIDLVDMDGDGDLDILCSNGDSFDDKYVKPCHGVQWLENRGELNFTHHRLTDLPGTYHALAGDIDGDGDMDVVAAVWVEPKVKFANPGVQQWASLVCLEQTSPGKFARHTLETDFPWHATLELADFDQDGDLDIAVGSHSRVATVDLPYWLAVWWNQGPS